MKHLTLILFAVLLSCNQTNTGTGSGPESDSATTPIVNKPGEATDGIIYFSDNNGLTWENKSEGLPAATRLSLSDIAVSGNTIALATKDSGVYFFNLQNGRWDGIPTNKKIMESNPGPITFFKKNIYVGTQKSGVFSSTDGGVHWINLRLGLSSLTIRKLVVIDSTLYAGTNAGLYSYNERRSTWEPEYEGSTLQVNGITGFDGRIYIGTNQGVFASPKHRKEWKQIMPGKSLHNISSDDRNIYAMTYNELFASADKGQSWQSIQQGLPVSLYTFNVVKHGNYIFAGQWDGVYRKDGESGSWISFSSGLPQKFAIVNMNIFNGFIVVSGSERKLRQGMRTF